MIEKITIEGYKSIKELKDFELKPLNVLIGPNKGGKSNFLDFLGLIGEAARGKLSKGLIARQGISRVLWAGDDVPHIQTIIDFTIGKKQDELELLPVGLSKNSWSYSFGLFPSSEIGYSIWELVDGEIMRSENDINLSIFKSSDGAKFLSNELVISQLGHFQSNTSYAFVGSYLEDIAYYPGFDTSRGATIRKPIVIETTRTNEDTTLNSKGYNLTNVYYHLFNNHENQEALNEILSILESVFDGFEKLTFPPVHGMGEIQLGWREKYFKRPLYQSELSDGTLKFLCLLAIFMNPNPPSVVCIDEPEVGLHPQMLDVLAEVIDEASERMQIVITTHSPRFLRNFKPEDIVIVEAENGESKFDRLNAERLEKWLQDFNLDELWQMGELGGKM